MRRVRSLLRFGSSAEVDCHRRDSGEDVPLKRRVNFSSQNSAHEVTPYAMKYGVHPEFFFFGRKGDMKLTDSGIMEEMRRKDEGLAPLMLDGDCPP
jgi:hypothetical protein